MQNSDSKLKGLTSQQVLESRNVHGANELNYQKENAALHAIVSLFKDPMIVLLIVAAVIYFISGNRGDGVFMLAAIMLVAAISFFQDRRSRIALEKLKTFTQPLCKVIRDGELLEITSSELVVGDTLMVEEGSIITADGRIVQSNDFSVDQSLLTGESMPVFKDTSMEDNNVYSGTTVASGLAVIIVEAIGKNTKLAGIGSSLASIDEEKTPLELQINNFVKKMVVVGSVVFVIVWIVNYYKSQSLLDSLLKALTLAMSILPEEIPVAFTTFMAIGAWRLMRMGIVVKHMKTVETLGSATVICTDKTGTLTENKMALSKMYTLENDTILLAHQFASEPAKNLISLAMWSSEPIPFDPMEVALHNAYASTTSADERPLYKMEHEYPLSGKPPMMTHVFSNAQGKRIVACKGAPEAIINVSQLTQHEKDQIITALNAMTTEGLRVLGVGVAEIEGDNFPKTQQEISFKFIGLVAFHDPPKSNIAQVLKDFYKAGIEVKMVTGDNTATAIAIAKQVGFNGYDKAVTGDELLKMNEQELQQCVKDNYLFTRMFPDAKLRIINALKANQQIVAMTGDGVNDGPALKAAHIGIAMGKKGSEIARQAASLVLVEDDLAKMLDAVAMGRKIYENLKKAIQYIISIHIPIILTVFVPLVLGWLYPNIFSPVHVIFLELIMGPTCSIVYENEPMEPNTMQKKPRNISNTFFSWSELAISVLQGLAITAGTLGTYVYAVQQGFTQEEVRTMVFVTLITANVALTLVSRSFYYSFITSMNNKNKLVVAIIAITVALTFLLIYMAPLSSFFEFHPLVWSQLLFCIAVGSASVFWFELVKAYKRMYYPKN
jgi:P-type Ca2+ transporter type 2C